MRVAARGRKRAKARTVAAEAYERLVQDVVTHVAGRSGRHAGVEVNGGRRHRIQGKSGYRHQIDVSVRRPGELLVVEAKLHSRPVGVGTVNTLVGVLKDIAGADTRLTVKGAVVSQLRYTKGAALVAASEGVLLHQIGSKSQYVVRLFDHWFAARVDAIQVSSRLIGGELRTLSAAEIAQAHSEANQS